MGLKLKNETAEFLVRTGITVLACGYFYAWQVFLFPEPAANRVAYFIEGMLSLAVGAIALAVLGLAGSALKTLADYAVARWRAHRPH